MDVIQKTDALFQLWSLKGAQDGFGPWQKTGNEEKLQNVEKKKALQFVSIRLYFTSW